MNLSGPVASRTPRAGQSRWWLRAARVVLALVLLGVLLHYAGWQHLLETVRGASWPLLAAALGITGLRLPLLAWRWQWALAGCQRRARFWSLLLWYTEACFFNLLLPSALGGDAVRAWRLARASGASVSVSTVLAERVLGLVALVALAAVGLILAPAGLRRPDVYVLLLVMVAACGVACAILFYPRWARSVAGAMEQRGWSGPARFVTEAAESLWRLRSSWTALLGVALLSLVMQLLGVIAAYVTGRALGLDLGLQPYLVVLPIAWLLGMIPLTPNGVGTREAVSVVLLGAVGVPAAAAVAFSLLSFALTVTFALMGALVHLMVTVMEKDRPRPGEAVALVPGAEDDAPVVPEVKR
jgi:glycosyltransferase 2 family protein